MRPIRGYGASGAERGDCRRRFLSPIGLYGSRISPVRVAERIRLLRLRNGGWAHRRIGDQISESGPRPCAFPVGGDFHRRFVGSCLSRALARSHFPRGKSVLTVPRASDNVHELTPFQGAGVHLYRVKEDVNLEGI